MNRLVLCAAALLVTGAAQAITNIAPIVPSPSNVQQPRLTDQQLTQLKQACQAIAGAKVVDNRCVTADGRAVSGDELKQAAAKASDDNG
ncbi:MAG: hypothetical protein ACJ8GK_11430 [Luteimonas sp.]